MTQVRAALDKVIAEAKDKPVTVPVQGSGQGGTAPTVAGVGGIAPTVAGVLATAVASASATATARSAVPTVSGVISGGAGAPIPEPMVLGQRLTQLEPHLQQAIAQNDPVSAAFLAQLLVRGGGTSRAAPTTASVLRSSAVQGVPSVAGGNVLPPIKLLSPGVMPMGEHGWYGGINLLPTPEPPPSPFSEGEPPGRWLGIRSGTWAFGGRGQNARRAGAFGSVGARGGGGDGPAFSSVFWGRGFTGIGVGFLAHMGFGIAEAGRTYRIDRTLAGNDQEAQTEALMAYRQNSIQALGWFGQAGGFLQDPTGRREAVIRSQVAAAAATDVRTQAMGTASQFTQSLRDEGALAQGMGAHDRRLKEIDIEHRKRLEFIKEEEGTRAKADQSYTDKWRANLEATRGDRATAVMGQGAFMAFGEKGPAGLGERWSVMEGIKEADDTLVSGASKELADKRAARTRQNRVLAEWTHGTQLFEAARDEFFTRVGALLPLASEFEVAGLTGAGNPRAARMASLRGRMSSDVFGAIGRREPGQVIWGKLMSGLQGLFSQGEADIRELGYLGEDIRMGGETLREGALTRRNVATAQLARQPLAADEAAIRGRRDQTILALQQERTRQLRDPDIRNSRALQDAVNEKFSEAIHAEKLTTDLEIRNARQSFGDEALLRQTAMMGRGRALDAALAGGVYGAVAASSVEISEQAKLTALQMKLSGREFGPGGANLVDIEYQNAIKQEKLLARNYERQFRPTEVNPMLVDTTGRSAGSQEAVKTLENILQEIRNLNQKFDLGVK